MGTNFTALASSETLQSSAGGSASSTVAGTSELSRTNSTASDIESIESVTSFAGSDDIADLSTQLHSDKQIAISIQVHSLGPKMVHPSIEDDDPDAGSSRRASGRARKLTARAKALSGTKLLPMDSPNIPRQDSSQNTSPSISPDPVVMSTSPAPTKARESKTTSPSEKSVTTSPVETLETRNGVEEKSEDPIRASKREKKPTAKVLDATGATQPLTSPTRKRSASPTKEETPGKLPRHSLSQAPRVPSRLRFSVCSGDREDTDVTVLQAKQAPELTHAPKTLQFDDTNSSKAKHLKPQTLPVMPRPQEKLIVTMPLPTKSAHKSPTFPAAVRKAEFVDTGCKLFCLDPPTRLLAFAQIAAESSDSDDSDDDDIAAPAAGLYDKWLEIGRNRFCVCGAIGHTYHPPKMLSEEELTQILEPNQAVQDQYQIGGSPASSSSAISFPPVNSIVKKSEGRRVSAFYNVVASSAPPAIPADRRRPKMAAPAIPAHPHPLRAQTVPNTPNTSKPLKIIGGGSYEERMQQDFSTIERVQQQARACGVQVKYDMSLDHLKNLIEEGKKKKKSASSVRLDYGYGLSKNKTADSTLKAADSPSKDAAPSKQSSVPKAKSVPLKLSKPTRPPASPGKAVSNDLDKQASQSPDPLTASFPISTPKKRKQSNGKRSPSSTKRSRTTVKGVATRRRSEVMVVD